MPIAGLNQRAHDFISGRMPLRALPFRPDIAIHTPTPQSGLVGWLASEGLDDEAPYWAYAWGGGAALALYLRDHPQLLAGRTVLDFGTGSGLVGIAAARAGAARVWAVDADPIAPVAARLNAQANGVALDLWDQPGLPEADIILAGDVFYDEAVVAETLPILMQAASAGTHVLIGDPFRRSLPLDRLDLLAEYDVEDMGGKSPVHAAVFALHPRTI
ncbi:50S ribosomal protein L11 methyltransferase [uncultured Devosia sp.]|uniref:class I SAM-dependent methyltransferase n=1 Tax=uncultured Devosia sp. TaxID=211434 RepID=UPI002605E879|nr:50S ribosomal protein L11 methyltransferase [uncultured Devosia sp.]